MQGKASEQEDLLDCKKKGLCTLNKNEVGTVEKPNIIDEKEQNFNAQQVLMRFPIELVAIMKRDEKSASKQLGKYSFPEKSLTKACCKLAMAYYMNSSN